MKYNRKVSSSRRKCRKRHYTAQGEKRIVIMSSRLSKELREKYHVKALPIRKGDMVKVLNGKFKGKEGTVQEVRKAQFGVYIDTIQKKGAKDKSSPIKIHTSNLMIIKPVIDYTRQKRIIRKDSSKTDDEKREALKELEGHSSKA